MAAYVSPTFLDGQPYPAATWQAMSDEVARLSGLALSSGLDVARPTTVGTYLSTSTSPSEAAKLRSASLNIVSGDLYRFHGQALYLAGDPWNLEIRKNSISGTLVGGARFPAITAGANACWDIVWPGDATAATTFYYVFRRLSGTGTIQLYGQDNSFYNSFAAIDRIGTSTLLRDVP